MNYTKFKVFDDIARIDITYKQLNGTTYDFYNRSNLPWTEGIRSRVEEYAALLSEPEQDSLISNLKSDWKATYFELFLANYFHGMGYQIATHPELPHTRKRPDFLLTGNGPTLYAEARVATDISDEERTEQHIVDEVIAGINKNVKSPDVFLNVWDVKVLSKQRKSLKGLYAALRTYIKEKQDIVRNTPPQSRWHDRFKYDDGATFVECTLIPKTVQSEDYPNDRIVGMQTQPGRFVQPGAPLKRAIEKKANRYGRFDKPYVICVQIGSGFGASNSELDDLLFGRGIYNLDTKKSWREHDGMFGSPSNLKMTRVSGILFVETHEANPAGSVLRYYKNPSATFPFDFIGDVETHEYDWEEVSVRNRNTYDRPIEPHG